MSSCMFCASASRSSSGSADSDRTPFFCAYNPRQAQPSPANARNISCSRRCCGCNFLRMSVNSDAKGSMPGGQANLLLLELLEEAEPNPAAHALLERSRHAAARAVSDSVGASSKPRRGINWRTARPTGCVYSLGFHTSCDVEVRGG
jgi:hypothetical protein